MGPHPFPTIVRDFQAVISKEIKEQMLECEGKLPDAVLACVGGGSNAIGTGRLGIFHGMKSYFCQDDHGQIAPVYSISAGLDYPGIGTEHAYLHDTGRAQYVSITDDQAVEAFEYLQKLRVSFLR